MNLDRMTDSERSKRSLFEKLVSELSDAPVLEAMRRVPRERFVAAAAPNLPLSLLSQLEPGGRMVVPVGDLDEQVLMKIVKSGEGFSTRTIIACRFVPLIAEDAWPDDVAPGGIVNSSSR